MTVTDILVHELLDEHKDREWVDKWGTHLAWCEDTWMYRYPGNTGDGWHPLPDGISRDSGPFMDGLHHRLLWG